MRKTCRELTWHVVFFGAMMRCAGADAQQHGHGTIGQRPAGVEHDQRGYWFSHCGQDHTVHSLFASEASTVRTQQKRFFVDLAANHAFELSNTRALERDGNWDGICIDANPQLIDELRSNRRCTVIEAIVSSTTGATLEFAVDGNDQGGRVVEKGGTHDFNVTQTTLRLEDALRKADAPRVIDYLSLDVEGHEESVLHNFNWRKWTFLAITIEHPSSLIKRWLLKKGYHFVMQNCWYDDQLWLHSSFPGGLEAARARAVASVRIWTAWFCADVGPAHEPVHFREKRYVCGSQNRSQHYLHVLANATAQQAADVAELASTS